MDENWIVQNPANRAAESLLSQLAIFSTTDALPDWPTAVSEPDRLRGGVYSPFQLLLWRCAQALGDKLEDDYPFLTGLVGLASHLALLSESAEPAIAVWPPTGDSAYRPVRRVLQSAFHLRELREEGEALSVEMRVPSAAGSPPDLDLKRFAQVFGRGVGIAEGSGLGQIADPSGRLQWIWPDHDGAPISTLYNLTKPYGKIPSEELRMILRRDGLITIAADENPLLEFYDGGWHTVDLSAGAAMIETLLTRHFGAGKTASGLSDGLLSLAYHMASHWHAGILGVVDADAETILERPSEESTKINAMIRQAMLVLKSKQDAPRVTEVKETGLGRVLLTCAIQDGATLFQPDGTLHSSARILTEVASHVKGGAGTRAAKRLSQYGVAIKVSRDGGVRVFSGGPCSTLLPENGLRIR